MGLETGKSDVAKAILMQLKDPFKPNLVKYATVGGGKTISYVDARDVMKRLDDILGMENWRDSYVRTDGGFICLLELFVDGKWLPKSGVSNDTKIAPQKGGESGAFKRAAVKFGIGRYFYYFDPLKWTPRNVDSWPEIFKPGAPENWEDVAELKYGVLEGMEESYGEFGEEVISNLDKIRGITDNDKLNEFFQSLDEGQQNALGAEFKAQSTANNTAAINAAKAKATKPAAKPAKEVKPATLKAE